MGKIKIKMLLKKKQAVLKKSASIITKKSQKTQF
jgi:hypothetical protein